MVNAKPVFYPDTLGLGEIASPRKKGPWIKHWCKRAWYKD